MHKEVTNMKHYTPLPLPPDSAWERKTWRRYAPVWFKTFIDGIKNLIDWLPVIWKDRHWDDHYIFEVLKRKLVLQRKHLVEQNRHMNVPIDNRDITICLNLIERVQEEYYGLEMYDYTKTEFQFTPLNDGSDCSELEINHISDTLDEYFAKHRAAVKKCLKADRNLSGSKHDLAFAVSQYKEKQCHDLLFRILNERIKRWWD